MVARDLTLYGITREDGSVEVFTSEEDRTAQMFDGDFMWETEIGAKEYTKPIAPLPETVQTVIKVVREDGDTIVCTRTEYGWVAVTSGGDFANYSALNLYRSAVSWEYYGSAPKLTENDIYVILAGTNWNTTADEDVTAARAVYKGLTQ